MWLTSAVAEVLDKVLGGFVEGIDAESLKLSVWNGDIKLRGLLVKADAIEAHLAEAALPVRVVGATLGEVQVKVPWRNLGSEPMVVRLDRIFIVLAAKEPRAWDEAEQACTPPLPRPGHHGPPPPCTSSPSACSAPRARRAD